jgi:hypothetical protein
MGRWGTPCTTRVSGISQVMTLAPFFPQPVPKRAKAIEKEPVTAALFVGCMPPYMMHLRPK